MARRNGNRNSTRRPQGSKRERMERRIETVTRHAALIQG